MRRRRYLGGGFSPRELFSDGTIGAWYDLSDLSTLFQNTDGTSPVTASGNQVGLMLDKSKGLVLGSQLVTNGDFSSSTGWTLAAGGGGSATISGGILTLSGGSATYPSARQLGILTSNRWYQVTVVLSSSITINSLALGVGGASSQYASFADAGTYTVIIFSDGTDLRLIRNSGYSDTANIDSIYVRELPGNHAVAANITTSRPTYTVSSEKSYLSFDGSNDSMATNAIDLTGTDKVTVLAGIRKSSDAAQGVVVEFSPTIASNNGSFLLSAPNSAAANYNWSSKGTTQVNNTVTTYSAPHTSVISGQANIAAPSNIIRVNSSEVGNVTTTQGTGNFGNHKLFIGRRNNASLPFNGRIYSMIIAARTLTYEELLATESWINRKTGAF